MGQHHTRGDAQLQQIRRFAEQHDRYMPADRGADDIAALREENEQLRTLVIQLSRIVARNVLDRK